MIETDGAPRPAGHYAQAVVHGGFVFAAGQLPLDPPSGQLVPGGAREQTARVLQNLQAVLQAAGSGLQRVVQLRVYVTEVAHWPEVNAACAAAFGAHTPARTVVPCGPLRHGALVEADAVAVV